TTLVYCLYLHAKERTFGEYVSSGGPGLGLNYMMSVLTGVLWYGQFFFYGLGHVRMGSYKFTSWAIHMIMLVLLSSVTGLLMKEWKNCSRKTIITLITALVILMIAILLLTYGNYLGEAGNT
ncbi:MAG TPA: L-rhamnose/proton symporter RhaT, partial [Ferruginibacter sp.]|nr:L-rhamnose/proton symporter RhaT [Ferruginibacter sp.]